MSAQEYAQLHTHAAAPGFAPALIDGQDEYREAAAESGALRDLLAEAIYAGGDEAEWLTTVDGSPNSTAYEIADRVLAVLRPAQPGASS